MDRIIMADRNDYNDNDGYENDYNHGFDLDEQQPSASNNNNNNADDEEDDIEISLDDSQSQNSSAASETGEDQDAEQHVQGLPPFHEHSQGRDDTALHTLEPPLRDEPLSPHPQTQTEPIPSTTQSPTKSIDIEIEIDLDAKDVKDIPTPRPRSPTPFPRAPEPTPIINESQSIRSYRDINRELAEVHERIWRIQNAMLIETDFADIEEREEEEEGQEVEVDANEQRRNRPRLSEGALRALQAELDHSLVVVVVKEEEEKEKEEKEKEEKEKEEKEEVIYLIEDESKNANRPRYTWNQFADPDSLELDFPPSPPSPTPIAGPSRAFSAPVLQQASTSREEPDPQSPISSSEIDVQVQDVEDQDSEEEDEGESSSRGALKRLPGTDCYFSGSEGHPVDPSSNAEANPEESPKENPEENPNEDSEYDHPGDNNSDKYSSDSNPCPSPDPSTSEEEGNQEAEEQTQRESISPSPSLSIHSPPEFSEPSEPPVQHCPVRPPGDGPRREPYNPPLNLNYPSSPDLSTIPNLSQDSERQPEAGDEREPEQEPEQEPQQDAGQEAEQEPTQVPTQQPDDENELGSDLEFDEWIEEELDREMNAHLSDEDPLTGELATGLGAAGAAGLTAVIDALGDTGIDGRLAADDDSGLDFALNTDVHSSLTRAFNAAQKLLRSRSVSSAGQASNESSEKQSDNIEDDAEDYNEDVSVSTSSDGKQPSEGKSSSKASQKPEQDAEQEAEKTPQQTTEEDRERGDAVSSDVLLQLQRVQDFVQHDASRGPGQILDREPEAQLEQQQQPTTMTRAWSESMERTQSLLRQAIERRQSHQNGAAAPEPEQTPTGSRFFECESAPEPETLWSQYCRALGPAHENGKQPEGEDNQESQPEPVQNEVGAATQESGPEARPENSQREKTNQEEEEAVDRDQEETRSKYGSRSSSDADTPAPGSFNPSSEHDSQPGPEQHEHSSTDAEEEYDPDYVPGPKEQEQEREGQQEEERAAEEAEPEERPVDNRSLAPRLRNLDPPYYPPPAGRDSDSENDADYDPGAAEQEQGNDQQEEEPTAQEAEPDHANESESEAEPEQETPEYLPGAAEQEQEPEDRREEERAAEEVVPEQEDEQKKEATKSPEEKKKEVENSTPQTQHRKRSRSSSPEPEPSKRQKTGRSTRARGQQQAEAGPSIVQSRSSNRLRTRATARTTTPATVAATATTSTAATEPEAPTPEPSNCRKRKAQPSPEVPTKKQKVDKELKKDGTYPFPSQSWHLPLGKSTHFKNTTKIARFIVSNAPTKKVAIYVFGSNKQGQLGLGHIQASVAQPTLNNKLLHDKVGVVEVAAGGDHCIALTATNKILTWGSNADGQLGRETESRAAQEMEPMEVDFSHLRLPKDTAFVQVVATESASFVLTRSGDVYGWGTFKETFTSPNGTEETIPIGFRPSVKAQQKPMRIPELSNVKRLAAGAQHVLAHTVETVRSRGTRARKTTSQEEKIKSHVYAWGAHERDQLGRKIIGRQRNNASCLIPRQCVIPSATVSSSDIASIGAGRYHSFATKLDSSVYAWGFNQYGQTGAAKQENVLAHDSTVQAPGAVGSLEFQSAYNITGGRDTSLALCADGRCLAWGAINPSTLGVNKANMSEDDLIYPTDSNEPAILEKPTLIPGFDGGVIATSSGPSHSIAVTKKGVAYAWGSNREFEVSSSGSDSVELPSAVVGGGLKEKRVVGAAAGDKFTVLLVEEPLV